MTSEASKERDARLAAGRPTKRILAAAGTAMLFLACACSTALAPTLAASAPPSRDAEEADANETSAPLNMIRFGPEQGLSRSVNDLVIDRQGFVWIATVDGLARYDGSGFKRWRHNPKRKYSLPSNNAMSIYADSQNRIWVSTIDSLSVLEKSRTDFRRIRFENAENRCVNAITVMKETQDGALWIGNLEGDLCRLDPGGKVSVFPLRSIFNSAEGEVTPIVMHEDYLATLWVGTSGGLLRFEKGKVEQSSKFIIRNEEISAISQVGRSELWVGSEKYLYKVGLDGSVLARDQDFPGGAMVVKDHGETYWIGSARGLYKTSLMSGNNRGEKKTTRSSLINSENQVKGDRSVKVVMDSSVFLMKKDEEGGLWVVGDVQGLSYLSRDSDRFIHIKSFGKFNANVEDVVAVTGNKIGQSWILSDSFIYQISPNNLQVDVSDRLESTGIVGPRSIEFCFGKVFVVDRDGIVQMSINLRKIKRIIKTKSENLLSYPTRIKCSRDRTIWVSHFGGDLESYSESGRLLFRRPAEQIFGHATPGTVELSFDNQGVPWYTNDIDMFRWSSGQFKRVRLEPGTRISAFAFRGNNELWLSRSGMLERYLWDGKKMRLIKRVAEQEGVPTVDSEGMAISSSGNIWLTTVRGLLLYDPKQNRARLFGIHDGLPGTDFYYGPPVMLGPNRAAALCADGLVFFDPERGLEPAKPSLLSIESLTLRRDGGEVALDPSRPVRMLAGDRDLRVVPRLLSFSNPMVHRYRSRLHGEDPEWVSQEGPSERVFSRLPPGRYTLELQAANADGAWSAPVSLSIEVMPPWWRSAWALVAYVLLASAFLWWLAYLDRLRLKRRHSYQLAKQKREWAEQASEAKSRFLADLGHELRTPMTGVLGMSELLLAGGLEPRQHGQAQSIRRAGEHLLRLVDDALDLARVEAGRLELQRVEFGLDAVIDEIAGLIAPLATRKGLRFSVERDPNSPDRWLGDPLRFKQIALNLLGNAVKFTERGSVGLRIETIPHSGDAETAEGADDAPAGLRLEVWDTGPGMTEEQVGRLFRRFEQAEGARTTARYGGTGLGLAISRELAIAMGGDIETRSTLGEGTVFVLTLPLSPVDADGVDGSAVEANLGEAATPMSSSSMSSTPATWCVVLLVEDDPTVAEVLTGLLQQQGHRVVHAAHGLAAMTEVAVGRFDAAFVDLDLPGIDGCALAEQLRASGFAAPMIAITARADAQAEPQARAAGFVEFLRKPTTGERLEGALRRALAAAGDRPSGAPANDIASEA